MAFYIQDDNDIKTYLKYAKNNGYKYILICRDLEDRDIFPIYFISIKDRDDYINCLISESKIEILDYLDVLF
jgi:pimeloyl-CoA synthetase